MHNDDESNENAKICRLDIYIQINHKWEQLMIK